MSGLMLIRPGAADEWTWSPAGRGADEPAHGSPQEAARAASDQRVVVLVPGPEVQLTSFELPVRNRRAAVAAVPWALEDRLAEEVESLHFAVGARAADGRWPVAIIGRDFLDHLLRRCADIGLDVHVALPEPLALPAPADNAWTTLEEAHRVTVRTGASSGFACEPELLPIVLASESPPGHVTRYCIDEVSSSQWPNTFAEVMAQAERIACRDPMGVLAGTSSFHLNLLQGAYSRGRTRLQQLRQWRLPAALAAGLVAVTLVQAALEYRTLTARQSQLRSQMEQLYREAFPEAQRVFDPRGQMEGQLRELRRNGNTGANFIETVNGVARPLLNNDNVRITQLTWRQGTLDLSLRTDQLNQIDRIQRALDQAGFDAELRGVERDGERVEGQLRLVRSEQ